MVSRFLRENDPALTDRATILRARFAAGLAEVHYPIGDGGQGLPRGYHNAVISAFEKTGARNNAPSSMSSAWAWQRPTSSPLARRSSEDRFVTSALAQGNCSDVSVHASQECIQLHGGIGFTWEHPAHLYLKRATADQVALGTPADHRAILSGLVDLSM